MGRHDFHRLQKQWKPPLTSSSSSYTTTSPSTTFSCEFTTHITTLSHSTISMLNMSLTFENHAEQDDFPSITMSEGARKDHTSQASLQEPSALLGYHFESGTISLGYNVPDLDSDSGRTFRDVGQI